MSITKFYILKFLTRFTIVITPLLLIVLWVASWSVQHFETLPFYSAYLPHYAWISRGGSEFWAFSVWQGRLQVLRQKLMQPSARVVAGSLKCGSQDSFNEVTFRATADYPKWYDTARDYQADMAAYPKYYSQLYDYEFVSIFVCGGLETGPSGEDSFFWSWRGFLLRTSEIVPRRPAHFTRWHTFQQQRVQVPLWFLVALTIMPAGIFFIRRRRERNARSWKFHGMCPACGYDLRASPERCPECGRPRGQSSAGLLDSTGTSDAGPTAAN